MTKEEISVAIQGKRILVTGGTGSFGREIVKALLPLDPAEMTVLSRDEKKQYDMQQEYSRVPGLKFLLGDVRDLERLRAAFLGVHIIFHAAALKQVPNCESNPFEAVRTNVLGAENVRIAALEAGVECVVAISTDKAVKPVNVMGMSKAIQERLMLQSADHNNQTRFVCVRYGNVLGSRGSVVPLFLNLLRQRKPLTVTHPEMTRFQLTLPEAVQLVLWATVKAKPGELWVRKMPSARVIDLARALALGVTGQEDYPIEIVGARPGEKMHEILVSEEEMWRAKEMGDHFVIPALHSESDQHGPGSGLFEEYASNTVHQLSIEEIHELLGENGWFDERSF